jgi:hypothetical protein
MESEFEAAEAGQLTIHALVPLYLSQEECTTILSINKILIIISESLIFFSVAFLFA